MKKLILLFISLFGFTAIGFTQNPWVNKKGSLYAQVSTSFIPEYTTGFQDDGGVEEITFATNDRTFSFYGSYSLTNRLEVTLNIFQKSVSASGNNLNNLGDPELQLKYQFPVNIPLAVYGSYTAPLSEREGVLRTGYNQHAVEAGLSVGVSKNMVFAYASSGFRYRDNIPNQISIDAEVGTVQDFGNTALLLAFHVDGVINTSEVTDPLGDQTLLYHNNGSFISPGIKASLNFYKNWWINVSGFGAIRATNQAASPGLSIGIAYKTRAGE